MQGDIKFGQPKWAWMTVVLPQPDQLQVGLCKPQLISDAAGLAAAS